MSPPCHDRLLSGVFQVAFRFILCHAGMFYYTLGNFRPQLRSTQQAVQLIACVSCPNLVKYGFTPVLEPFIRDVNTLYEVMVSYSSNQLYFLAFIACRMYGEKPFTTLG